MCVFSHFTSSWLRWPLDGRCSVCLLVADADDYFLTVRQSDVEKVHIVKSSGGP
ncbi:hypothetical protein BIFANG_02868 [Bifidobacterium angulatum DSM 20098 = JCM 7096]|uniref:Uncharacterized protein n=1 Tax=Bifidobacterium angulatum DSM 20098 = JCM 7096 TaxID=518635 RepID=C4FEX1_9BIFI|nr:hypothetical protein BIFANG_02868 [Bifidobacterium angulatum DSM 20098 = JCM 7096]